VVAAWGDRLAERFDEEDLVLAPFVAGSLVLPLVSLLECL